MDAMHEMTDEELGFRPVPEHTKVGFGLMRLAALLSDELDRELQDAAGLGLSDALVVVQIMLAGGRLKMADVADSVVLTRGGVTKVVDRLVEAGYLDRVPAEHDRRVVYAVVTELAFEYVRDNQELFDAVIERRIAKLLDPEELSTMHTLLDRLCCENPGWEPPVPDHVSRP